MSNATSCDALPDTEYDQLHLALAIDDTVFGSMVCDATYQPLVDCQPRMAQGYALTVLLAPDQLYVVPHEIVPGMQVS